MKKLLIIILCITVFSGCSKEDKISSTSVIIDKIYPKNPLDIYIEETFLKPYNIEILYKYVDKESNLRYNLIPASYDGSVRLTKLLYYAGISPYDELTGSKQFIRDNFARLINYIGNVAVQNNGVEILGTIESGTKITLYNVINLNATNGINPVFLNSYYFKTIHHEFQHILNQRKPFPASFNEITGTTYVDDAWNTIWTLANPAIRSGYISNYASKAPTEDFAELYSFYITRSQAQYDAIVNGPNSTPASVALLNAKIAIVKNYMQNEWGINMDQLRSIILSRLANLNSFDQTSLN